jgi:hypothetical protein
MISRKNYIKPKLTRIELDQSVSLMMMSAPHDPPPIGGSKKVADEPFKSPFGDKPFS